jgi:hypothetical protein
MTMDARLRVLLLAIATGMLAAGCATSGPTALSKASYSETFSDVLRKSFAETKNDNVCLPQLFGFGNVATDSAEVGPDNASGVMLPNRNAQFKALESVGLVSGVESERTVAGKAQHFTTYRRTAQGEATFFNATFCYARIEFDRVVKWKGPVILGDYRVAWVYYAAKPGHVADWARAPAIIAAFPTVKAFLNDPPKERQVAIDLSSEGWGIAEYSKLLQVQ